MKPPPLNARTVIGSIALLLIATLTTAGTILVGRYSTETRPHRHYYTLRMKNREYRLNAETTPNQRHLSDYGMHRVIARVLIWRHGNHHTIRLHDNQHPVSVLGVENGKLRWILVAPPGQTWQETIRAQYVAELPRQDVPGGLRTGDTITLTRHSNYNWGY